MKYLFLGVFVLSAAVHLYASAKKDTGMRNFTKPFILLSLLGFYVLSARSLSGAIVLALIFSWLGDVLLIRDVVFSRIPAPLILVLTVFFAATVAVVFSKLKPHLPKALFYPMFLYLLINGAMNCFAVFRCACSPSAATITTAVGAALFFISDASLFFVRFHKESRLKTHFLVMLTYSLGEMLIVLGLI